ncbi:MAG: NADH-quinone oxidoreductase subunit N [Anaerolineae bacterium]
MNLSDLNYAAALPALSLALGATVLLFLDVFIPKNRKDITAWLAIIGVVVSAILTLSDFGKSDSAFNGMYVQDSFTALVNLTALITAFLSILAAYSYLKRTNTERGEYYPLLLFSTAGAMFMGSSGDLVMVFVALELLSIPLYVLAGFRRPDPKSEESAMKYFLLGAFATGFLVYGIALMYGATGTTNLHDIFAKVSAGELTSSFLLLLGSGLLLVGLGFKVAAVPFHMWTPDVYQGAPTPVTAFMSVAAKVGGFAALLRVLTIAVPSLVVTGLQSQPGQTVVLHAAWQDAVAVMAGLTVILGNFVAIQQRDIKRLLAYSSIAQGGYILMAVAAAGSFVISWDATGNQTVSFQIAQSALQGAVIYLMAYAFTNIGAFTVAIAVEKDDGTGTLLDDFSGLGKSRPLLALGMSIFMLSLTGIPLTGGFTGKWFVFYSAVSGQLTVLALLGVLTSVISAYYYLRVIVKMWFETGEADAKDFSFALRSAVVICVIGVLILGTVPFLINAAQSVTAVALR